MGPDDTPQIEADWIRELVVTGQIPETQTPVHAKGVRIRGVVLDGPLDLESARLAVPMHLDTIEAGEPIVFDQATGSWIAVTNSQLAGVSATQLRLDHSLDLSGTNSRTRINLHGAKITGDVFLGDGFTAQGEVRLLGASVGGQLTCRGGTFTNEDGDALSADGAEIGGDVLLRD